MPNTHPILARLAAAALLATTVVPAWALESVVVNAPGAPEGMQSRLEVSSLLVRQLAEQNAAIKKAKPKWYTPWRKAPEEVQLPTTTDVLATARAEYKRMLSVLYGEGYYGGVVSVKIDGREAAEISPLNPPASITSAVVTVQPGPEFTFAEASVQPLPPETTVPSGYKAGEIAKSGEITSAAKTATSGWRNAGHPKVDLVGEDITANHANAKVSSRLTLDPGPRLRFGPMVISGNKRVRTERIAAIAGLPTGEVYDPEEINDAGERLRRSGAFRSVSMVEAETPGPGDQIAIETTVLEDKRRRIGFGGEISTQEGGRINAYWMHRNLLGGAENLRFDLEIENIGSTEVNNGVDYRLSGVFRRPATWHPDLDLLLRAYIEHEDEPGYVGTIAEIGGAFAYHVSDELELLAGLDYRGSEVEDAFGYRKYTMTSIPLRLEWDKRDDELDPTRGFYLDTLVRPFAGIYNMEDGALTEIDGRGYLGFGEKRNTVLAGRAQLGSLYGPEIPSAPQDYLFFAGGGGSVRGQPYQSLGVGEVDGVIVGGRSYVALSGEIRSYVKGNLGIVGFYDAGYVGAEEFYDGSGTWMSGAGLGVRFKTGFGPIRVDVGTPVAGGPEDANPVQLYIGIGQAF